MTADWLRTDYRTLFRLGRDGRIAGENDPECSPGPLLWLAGCASGNIFGLHADLPDDLAGELEGLLATEPPFMHPATPRHFELYLALLGGGDHARHNFGLIYDLPHDHPYANGVQLVGSDSDDGQAIIRSWKAEGVPEALFELGFREVADFWAPWCAALVGGDVASIAFAARLADAGAELGLATVKAFRGRGLAACATAGWSRLPALRSRTLFYSTDRDNVASQRVAARLDLRLRAASLRISEGNQA
ncbi:GNAT family N-acetyltransferase [Mesorhizobium sp. B2-9-1]|uniref:GNAT family N-acetyltransferase n=1 Tax=unclassified Mesorhizobium TaxID=325217 RepID=UPI00112A8003|nr:MULTISPECIES: GNAT family N-acetyltransferase [unclassified Mesorhizobium]TPI46207.1 GNAT family N-acetyltransferase [Mesorhizobium sp. B2-9-1]TPJ30684.1 GNAT family N-acetyltransferase [Mesorhizobium sp. B2-7-2]